MNYGWTRATRQLFAISPRNRGKNILTIVCLQVSAPTWRIASEPRSNTKIRYVTWLSFHAVYIALSLTAYSGSQKAARPVRSSVWPSCSSTWNRKRRFLRCCPRTMRSRKIPERTWARSNCEMFYRQRGSENIHFSGWKSTNWNVTSNCISRSTLGVTPFAALSKNTVEKWKGGIRWDESCWFSFSSYWKFANSRKLSTLLMFSLALLYPFLYLALVEHSLSTVFVIFVSNIFQISSMEEWPFDTWNSFVELVVDIFVHNTQHSAILHNAETFFSEPSRGARTCGNRCDATGNQTSVVQFAVDRIRRLSSMFVRDSRSCPSYVIPRCERFDTKCSLFGQYLESK